jgi:hypothetical protein
LLAAAVVLVLTVAVVLVDCVAQLDQQVEVGL